MTDPPFVIASATRDFAVPAERVFDAWLDPIALGRWMFGPDVRDERIVSLTLDPHVGGEFSFMVERGGATLDHVGQYLEIERPTRLVLTWGMREQLPECSYVEVIIAPSAAGCTVALAHEMNAKWTDYLDRVTNSWRLMLDNLAGWLTP